MNELLYCALDSCSIWTGWMSSFVAKQRYMFSSSITFLQSQPSAANSMVFRWALSAISSGECHMWHRIRFEYSSFLGIRQTSTCSLNFSLRDDVVADPEDPWEAEFSSSPDEKDELNDGESSSKMDSWLWSDDPLRPKRAANAHRPDAGFSPQPSSSGFFSGSVILTFPSVVSCALEGGLSPATLLPSTPNLKSSLLRIRCESPFATTVAAWERCSLIVVLLHSWSIMIIGDAGSDREKWVLWYMVGK